MKYTAKQETSGTWFVRTMRNGRGYRFDTEQQAKEQALTMSMSYYHDQVEKAWHELQKLTGCEYEEEVLLFESDSPSTMGDLLC